MVTLSATQQAAIDFVLEQFDAGQLLVAIRGLAGTGKTTLIPALQEALLRQGVPVAVGSPTHRAAMILRSKGLSHAKTLHSHALTPYFQPEYAACMWFLGEECPTKATGDELAAVEQYRPSPADNFEMPLDPPLLLAVAMQRRQVPIDVMMRRRQTYTAKQCLESVGLHGRMYFDGFGPKKGEGCLIIDEASMVGQETLTLCQQAFPLVCLVGDPGQLPPVKETAALQDVLGVDLTEIHRQAADSPIIQLAYRARTGDSFQAEMVPGQLEEWLGVKAENFLESPLIVWRNATRLSCTAAIREALGYPKDALVAGEPLVCRSTDEHDRADGFINNTLWRVVEVDPHNPQAILVKPDGSEDDNDRQAISAHVEELHGEAISPGHIPWRFGYCLTAHTAQGGEWPTVYIAKPDMTALYGASRKKGRPQEAQQWAYTAITRAKDKLCFLTHYTFTENTPATPRKERTPMPKMVAKQAESPEVEASYGPEPEGDIPDVALPTTLAAELAQAPGIATPIASNVVDFAALMPGTGLPAEIDLRKLKDEVLLMADQALWKMSEHVLTCIKNIDQSWDNAVRILNGQQSALQGFTEALKGYAPVVPYSTTLHCMSPSQYPMSLTVQAPTQEQFIERLVGTMSFLKENGFTPGSPA